MSMFALIVLQYGSDQGLVCGLLQFSCPNPQVPSQEAKSFVCLGAKVIHVFVPAQILVDGDSQVFGRGYSTRHSLDVQIIL